MAKLYFYYSAMNAGKTTTLLQSSYNYNERGMDTLLFTPIIDDRAAVGTIASRIGLEKHAYAFAESFDFFDYIKEQMQNNNNIRCILVDESHFLAKQQVQQLAKVSDVLKVPVLAYGLRTDFMGELFEGSQYLLAWADELIEIKTICHCGSKATMNARIDSNGKVVREGEQIEIGDNDRYISLCRKHFWSGQTQSEQFKVAA